MKLNQKMTQAYNPIRPEGEVKIFFQSSHVKVAGDKEAGKNCIKI